MIKTLWSVPQESCSGSLREGTPDHTAWQEKLEGQWSLRGGRTWAESWDEFSMRSSTVRLGVGQIQGTSPRKRRLICKGMKAHSHNFRYLSEAGTQWEGGRWSINRPDGGGNGGLDARSLDLILKGLVSHQRISWYI